MAAPRVGDFTTCLSGYNSSSSVAQFVKVANENDTGVRMAGCALLCLNCSIYV